MMKKNQTSDVTYPRLQALYLLRYLINEDRPHGELSLGEIDEKMKDIGCHVRFSWRAGKGSHPTGWTCTLEFETGECTESEVRLAMVDALDDALCQAETFGCLRSVAT
jgi:hypothetical protein